MAESRETHVIFMISAINWINKSAIEQIKPMKSITLAWLAFRLKIYSRNTISRYLFRGTFASSQRFFVCQNVNARKRNRWHNHQCISAIITDTSVTSFLFISRRMPLLVVVQVPVCTENTNKIVYIILSFALLRGVCDQPRLSSIIRYNPRDRIAE